MSVMTSCENEVSTSLIVSVNCQLGKLGLLNAVMSKYENITIKDVICPNQNNFSCKFNGESQERL